MQYDNVLICHKGHVVETIIIVVKLGVLGLLLHIYSKFLIILFLDAIASLELGPVSQSPILKK